MATPFDIGTTLGDEVKLQRVKNGANERSREWRQGMASDVEAAEWPTVDARTRGLFDANGLVVSQCPRCGYETFPHRPGGSRSNEAKRQHWAAKHEKDDDVDGR